LHMAQLMPPPLTVSRFSKIQIGFIFLVPAHPGSPERRAVKRVCVCVCGLCNYIGLSDAVVVVGRKLHVTLQSSMHERSAAHLAETATSNIYKHR